MRLHIICVEAVETILHVKGISDAFDNCFWPIPKFPAKISKYPAPLLYIEQSVICIGKNIYITLRSSVTLRPFDFVAGSNDKR